VANGDYKLTHVDPRLAESRKLMIKVSQNITLLLSLQEATLSKDLPFLGWLTFN